MNAHKPGTLKVIFVLLRNFARAWKVVCRFLLLRWRRRSSGGGYYLSIVQQALQLIEGLAETEC
jgi:hypothetical protein